VTAVLIDTGWIVALLDRSEASHCGCVTAIADIRDQLVTCEAVIAEACCLVRDLPGAADAIIQNVERGVFQVPFRLCAAAPEIRKLLKKYSDVPMDLADACLVALAGLLNTPRVLTLDSDFEIYRWGRNHAFEIIGPEPA
jgi:predicted nucleic acid-binding protein